MVGTELEVCWRYWRPPTDEEKAAGEKRKKIGEKIWCEGKVEQVANGTTDKESARCKNLLKAAQFAYGGPQIPCARSWRRSPGTIVTASTTIISPRPSAQIVSSSPG